MGFIPILINYSFFISYLENLLNITIEPSLLSGLGYIVINFMYFKMLVMLLDLLIYRYGLYFIRHLKKYRKNN